MKPATFTVLLGLFGSAFAASPPSWAGWSAISGKITNITTYDHTEVILFSLANQPSSPIPPGCTTIASFGISADTSTEKRGIFLSQLLSAQRGGSEILVTWEDAGDCVAYDGATIVPRLVRLNSVP